MHCTDGENESEYTFYDDRYAKLNSNFNRFKSCFSSNKLFKAKSDRSSKQFIGFN